MNRPLRKMTVVALLLAAGTLVSVCRAAAVAPKPALTITCAGYDKALMNGLKVLDGLSGRGAKLAAKAEAQLVGTVHGKDLAGLDRSSVPSGRCCPRARMTSGSGKSIFPSPT